MTYQTNYKRQIGIDTVLRIKIKCALSMLRSRSITRDQVPHQLLSQLYIVLPT